MGKLEATMGDYRQAEDLTDNETLPSKANDAIVSLEKVSEEPLPVTQITIDGKAEDWNIYKDRVSIIEDPTGDQLQNSPDYSILELKK